MKYIVPGFLAALFLLGCNKDNSTPTKTTTIITQISYTGVQLPGQTIAFSASAPAGSTYLWNFGDSSATSTEAKPNHVYSNSGTYNVTLELNGNSNLEIGQSVDIYTAPQYTSQLAGSRTWEYTIDPPFGGGEVTKPDTTFSITYLNPVQIMIGADTLYYMQSGSYSYYLTFVHYSSSILGLSYDLELNYDYSSNNIVLYQYIQVDTAGSVGTETKTFTYP